MKRIILAAVCSAILAWAIPNTAAWSGERVNPAEIRPNLFGACFLSPQEGWVIGDRGRIFYTTDGGKSFERLETGTTRAFLGIVCFPDKSLVLVGKSGTVFRSPDGGKTFQPQTSGTERNLAAVAFGDKQTGIVVGDAGTIMRTTDGGTTWKKIPVPQEIPLPEDVQEVVSTDDLLFYDVSFPSPERAWIVGEFGVILASVDGGATWTAQKSPVQSTLFGVNFTDVNNGWCVGLSSVMARTRDGGQTWETVDVPRRPGFMLSLYSVQVRGPYAWAIGDSGYLLTSTDGGGTWKLVNVPIQLAATWLRGISLSDNEGRGMIAGAEGLLLATDRDTFRPLRNL